LNTVRVAGPLLRARDAYTPLKSEEPPNLLRVGVAGESAVWEPIRGHRRYIEGRNGELFHQGLSLSAVRSSVVRHDRHARLPRWGSRPWWNGL